MKLIDAVYEVLKDSAAPMGAEELERVVRERGLYETKGKTLYASIGAAMYTDRKTVGAASRFVKCGKGRFAVAGSAAAKVQPELALGVGRSVPVSDQHLQGGQGLQMLVGKKNARVKCRGAGYVYILTNKCMKGMVKIGMTSRPVDTRSKELFNTSLPMPFDEFASLKTSKFVEVEDLVHRILTKLTRKRVNESREFYKIKPGEALEILEDVSRLLDPADCEFRLPGREESVVRKPARVTSRSSSETVFVCRGAGADAKAKLTDKGFVVLRGSKVSPKIVPSMKRYARSMFDLRNELERAGIIANGIFKQQYVFTSPSAAASLVQGRNSNGNTDWRTADGVKFGEIAKGT